VFNTVTILTVTAAFFAYINHKTLKLPFTIGIMIGGLLASATILLLHTFLPYWGIGNNVLSLLHSIDFPTTLLNGMLSFLLFAGALHVDLGQLRQRARSILTLATMGVILSTFLIGAGTYGLIHLLGSNLPFICCLVFGALISPTDPVAVLGIMKAAGAPIDQEVTIVGESLFNDGVGVVVFTLLLAIAVGASSGEATSLPMHISLVFLKEVVGGLLLGFTFGYITYRVMHTLNEPHLEVFMSVALVMTITAVAIKLHTSAPLACVVAGLFIGNHGRMFAMSDETRQTLDLIWEFIDVALNAVLFLLVGLEVVHLANTDFTSTVIFVSLLAVPLSLAARFISVAIPVKIFRRRDRFTRGTTRVLTWGGLKGAISIALALSLPSDFEGRTLVITATYAVVIFSIIVQGLTVGYLIKSLVRVKEKQ
jgi:CPA1 family monovalent cation:H+ antiporter